MALFADNAWFLLALVLSAAMAAAGVYFWDRRAARPADTKLHDIVKLDAGGWRLLMWIGVAGAVVMIGSSIAIGIDYWVGLAIEADTLDPETGTGKIDPDFTPGTTWTWNDGLERLWHITTAGVVSFLVIAVIMEVFADLGTPWAAALERKKNPLLARLVVVGFAMAIVMSLVTKWGYYDDKRDFRSREAAQTAIEQTDWLTKRQEAQAVIDEIGIIPTDDEIAARRTAAEAKRDSLEAAVADARAARDRLRSTHSSNLVRYQERIDDLQAELNTVLDDLALLAALPSQRARLDQAMTARDTAIGHMKETAGKLTSDGGEKVRAGDIWWVRALRVGCHQFLCFLFPLLALFSRTAWKEEKAREEANAKRRKTMEDKENTFDVTPDAYINEPAQVGVGDEYWDERAEAEAAALRAAANGHDLADDDYDGRLGDDDQPSART